MRRAGVFLVLATLGFAWCGGAAADVFILTNGGRLVGELLNPDQVPRQTYQIRTSTGGQITLSRSQVQQQQRQPPPAQVEYEKIRPRYPDTVDGQWALAEWCRERNLQSNRNLHLQRILQLDPDHEKARRALKYYRRDGEWKTQKEIMEEQGLTLYRGKYRTRQEIELMEERQSGKSERGEWMQKLSRWRDWLGSKRSRLACEQIQSIDDPAAVPALQAALSDPRDEARILFIEALARIGTPAAKEVLAYGALHDLVPEVRLTCLDHLKKEENPEVVAFFIDQLRHGSNDVVNRAGLALEKLGDPTAIGPLIDALITVHKVKVQKSNPGQISTTFGSGGGGSPGGLSVGGEGPRIVPYQVRNQMVLDALVSLTGGVDYGFNVPLWKAWYAAQKRHPDLDARRD